ncbi:MAG: 16S rRNA (adenine(1518)-N(6)/adenine(1519)-N(6))-dimethyltransferase RsmA [Streptosporangiales bacterium]|nr:16S rRNA (adenine(1518)-N(6)/adenine(1519)-N(6))-dimethyltransferase RsmA [Streptosporangiales bacterium]
MTDASAGSGLLGPADVRLLAEQLGIRPTKTRGQNFMVDVGTVRRIVRTSGVTADDVVLEVGPGLGSLTLGLLPAARHVLAVEVDRSLAAALPRTVAAYAPAHAAGLTVVERDAMRVTPDDLAGWQPTALVANLPYNVAVPVLVHLLSTFPTLAGGLVLVQAEVAQRLAAGPGSRVYGVPSVKAAWFAHVRKAGAVNRGVFWPRPNVDSELVAFARREPPATSATRAQVFAAVDAAFGQRRKTLRVALADWAGGADRAESMLVAAGVDPRARGETLDVAAFARLAEQAARADPYDARP